VRLSPGTVLARRYQLTASLGEGGMGEVWAARHVLTGKAVAVKLLIYAAHERGFREARARFALEARSACAVDHPNVVEIFDFVESDEPAPFIVMELLQGETLAARLARGPIESVREACRLLLPVVSAVGTAHERGIVHRDLKPSNIFLGARPGEADRAKVKVLDFGIAKWFAGDEPGLRTRTGSTLGTPSTWRRSRRPGIARRTTASTSGRSASSCTRRSAACGRWRGRTPRSS
jgi:serine/threonine-protein kinase